MAQTGVLASLPTEIVADILQRVDRADLRALRLVCRLLCYQVDPVLFSTLNFRLDREGCNALLGLADFPGLREKVVTLSHTRNRFLPTFRTAREWEVAVDSYFQNRKPDGVSDNMERSPKQAQPMSKAAWDGLTQSDRARLYNEYTKAWTEQESWRYVVAVRVASLFGATPVMNRYESRTSFQDVAGILEQTLAAFKKFSNLARLDVQPPAHREATTTIFWRDLGLATACTSDDDVIAQNAWFGFETVQLLFLLFMISTVDRGKIHIAKLFVSDVGGWDTAGRSTLAENLYSGSDILRWSPGKQYATSYASKNIFQPGVFDGGWSWRQAWLRLVQRFAAFDELDWSTWPEVPGYNSTALLAQIIRGSYDLRRLKFRTLHQAPYQTDPLRFERDWEEAHSANGVHLVELLQPSKHISQALMISPCLERITTLELSLYTTEHHLWSLFRSATALCHLNLSGVHFASGCGSWKSLLRNMASHLALNSFKARALVEMDETRMVWCICVPPLTATQRDMHERMVVDYVLGRTTIIPILDDFEFLERFFPDHVVDPEVRKSLQFGH